MDYCLNHPNPIVLYGGGGGGGKSYLLRTAIVEFNGYLASLGFKNPWGGLFCSTYNALQKRHLGRIKEELGHLGRIKETRIEGGAFHFDNPELGGCYLLNLDNPDNLRGSEMSYILVDELSEITKRQFQDLLYIRPKNAEQPFFPVLCASNPDGVGHSWIKKFWITRDFTGESYSPTKFFFVPALPTDNPLWQSSQLFRDQFLQLPEHLKKARLEGCWDAPSGARFPQLSADIHRFKVSEQFPQGIPATYPIIIGLDWGGKAPYCALWIAVDHNRNMWVFREDYEAGLTTDIIAERIRNKTASNETVISIYADNQMFQRRRDYTKYGAPSAPSFTEVIEECLASDSRFPPLTPGFKPSRAQSLGTLDLFFNRDNQYPNIFIEEGCSELWRELTGAIWDERGMLAGKKEDIDPRNPDHAISALYYAANTYIEGPKPYLQPDPTSQEIRAAQMADLYRDEQKQLKTFVRGMKRGRF